MIKITQSAIFDIRLLLVKFSWHAVCVGMCMFITWLMHGCINQFCVNLILALCVHVWHVFGKTESCLSWKYLALWHIYWVDWPYESCVCNCLNIVNVWAETFIHFNVLVFVLLIWVYRSESIGLNIHYFSNAWLNACFYSLSSKNNIKLSLCEKKVARDAVAFKHSTLRLSGL